MSASNDVIIGMFRRNEEKRVRRRTARPFTERPISHVLEGTACLLLAGAFSLGTYDYVRTDPVFRVKTIRVEGACNLTPESIIAESGVTADDCLILLSTGAVRNRVSAIPYVKLCRIGRIFPDKLVIAVQERLALATLIVNNRLYEVDDEGNVLRELGPETPHVPPFITNVPDLDYVEAGQRMTQPSLKAALAVWAAFSRTAMAGDVSVSEISAARENRVCMYCDELNFEIRWGGEDLERQAGKLDVFWRAQNKNIRCKEYLDLRFGNDVACK